MQSGGVVLVVSLEGNGQRESHKGDGYHTDGEMYTLNTTEVHAVAYGIDHAITTRVGGCTAQGKCVYENVEGTLKAKGVHAVAFDRAAYNQGKNAKYDFLADDGDTAPTIINRGPGGGVL